MKNKSYIDFNQIVTNDCINISAFNELKHRIDIMRAWDRVGDVWHTIEYDINEGLEPKSNLVKLLLKNMPIRVRTELKLRG